MRSRIRRIVGHELEDYGCDLKDDIPAVLLLIRAMSGHYMPPVLTERIGMQRRSDSTGRSVPMFVEALMGVAPVGVIRGLPKLAPLRRGFVGAPLVPPCPPVGLTFSPPCGSISPRIPLARRIHCGGAACIKWRAA